MSQWHITQNSHKLPNTEATTEQGAWNHFYNLHPRYITYSQSQMNKIGYMAKKDKVKKVGEQ